MACAAKVAPARTHAALENRGATGDTAAERKGENSPEILIFGGTVEGRQVSEYLTERQVAHTLCVATEYGVETARAQEVTHGRTHAAYENQCAVDGTAVETSREEDSLRTIHQGRMDAEQMCSFLNEGEYKLVVDATHPYAVEVSKNIREACGKENVPYLRYLRPQDNAEICGKTINATKTASVRTYAVSENCFAIGGTVEAIYVNSTKEAAEYLERQQGGIFLTTGSKELQVFTDTISDRSRLFARVLPSAEVVASCRTLGLEGCQICAMQGPFSTEINTAMLRQTGASFLVTKSTGASGGFPEKIEAARQCGVTPVIIRRPQESGFNWEEVKARLDAWILSEAAGETLLKGADEQLKIRSETQSYADAVGNSQLQKAKEQEQSDQLPRKEVDSDGQPCVELQELKRESTKIRSDLAISCIGIGMGTPDTLTHEALREMREAQVLFGAKRILESAWGALTDKSVYDGFTREEVLSYKEASGSQPQAKALSDGNDSNGFEKVGAGIAPEMIPEYSAAKIYDWLAAHPEYTRVAILMSGDVGFYSGARQVAEIFPASQVRYCCGISSVVYFASRIPTSWQDAKLVSAHGKDLALLNYVKKYPKLILLVSGATDVERFCRDLVEAGLTRVIVTVGTNLSYPEETIRTGAPEEFCSVETTGLHIVMIENPDAGALVTPGIPDEAFVRGKVPMTKEEIRSLSVAKLRSREDSVVYDVGAGTGSISIECARLCTEGKIFAIERNPDGISLIRDNKRKFAVSNLVEVEGTAPEALQDLPMPTHAFIGGSAGNMREIIETLRRKNPVIRIVINTVTMETIAEAIDLIRELEIEDADIVQISAAKSRPLGRYHMMTAHNPVYIISFGGEGRFV